MAFNSNTQSCDILSNIIKSWIILLPLMPISILHLPCIINCWILISYNSISIFFVKFFALVFNCSNVSVLKGFQQPLYQTELCCLHSLFLHLTLVKNFPFLIWHWYYFVGFSFFLSVHQIVRLSSQWRLVFLGSFIPLLIIRCWRGPCVKWPWF